MPGSGHAAKGLMAGITSDQVRGPQAEDRLVAHLHLEHRVGAMNFSLALAAPSPRARGILATTGLAKAFSVYDTEAEAVQACRQPAAG